MMATEEDSDLSTFTALRGFLFADEDLSYWALAAPSEDPDLQTVRKQIEQQSFTEGCKTLEALRAKLGDCSLYWFAAAYLAHLTGDSVKARRSLHEVLGLRPAESRLTLLTWKLLREFGEELPSEVASQVLGVVFETATGTPPEITSVAGYADGQIRWFCHPVGSVIGDNWTGGERQVAKRLVELGQAALHGLSWDEGRCLPEPGFAHVYLLTPAGSYRARESLEKINAPDHPLHQLCLAGRQIQRLELWRFGLATKQLLPRARTEALFDSVQRSDLEFIHLCLISGASVDAQYEGLRVLALAASRRDTEVVRLLVDRGADVNAKTTHENSQECPILILPATNGSVEILEILLDAGADVNASDPSGLTALMCAAFVGCEENLRILIRRSANLEARDSSGYSPLMYAANAGHRDCVAVLLAAGANVAVRDIDGNAPLAFAAQHGYREIVDLLLEAGQILRSRAPRAYRQQTWRSETGMRM